MKIFFSIITVCYNAEKTIKDTIESLLNQSYSNFEFIVIDGASIDNTLDIIESYDKKFKERKISYKWISEQDKGMYDGMNKGIHIAKGAIIGILNSDDWYEPQTLTLVHKLYEKTKEEGIFCGLMNRVKESKEPYKILYNKKEISSYIHKKMPVNHPATFVHKNVYEIIGGFNTQYRLSADYDFIFRSFKAGVPFVFTDEVLTNMRNSGATGQLKNLWITAKEDHHIRKKNNVKWANFYYLKRILFNGAVTIRNVVKRLLII